jgi:hypothetical protein
LQAEKGPDGGIGRRNGLKHHRLHWHAGSTPALGTKKRNNHQILRFFYAFFYKIWLYTLLISNITYKFLKIESI